MISTKRKVHFRRRPDKTRTIMPATVTPTPAAEGRIPRISRLMALAIHFDRLVREGRVRDQSELARLAHVTQPRMTQIMNLNLLAPDIQEELLELPRVAHGHDSIHESLVRQIVSELQWPQQRQLWQQLHSSRARM